MARTTNGPKLLNGYFKAGKELLDEYFGYVERYKVYPVQDCREHYWYLPFLTEVRFAASKAALFSDMADNYSGEIVDVQYVSKDKLYTMLTVDTLDGNVCLLIFDNAKQCVLTYL